MLEFTEQDNKKGIGFIIASSFCVGFGQLFWKLSSEKGMMLLLIGFFLYALGALLMMISYRYGKVSVLQPMLSISYVLSIILGAIVLNEEITTGKVIGAIIIIFGVILIAGGKES